MANSRGAVSWSGLGQNDGQEGQRAMAAGRTRTRAVLLTVAALSALAVLPVWATVRPSPAPAATPPPSATHRVVGYDELLAAMHASQGYTLTATANGARLHAEVLLRLIRAAHARDPHGPPLFIDRTLWFEAFLARTGLSADKAPLYARLAYEHEQDTEADYRSGRVIEKAVAGPQPKLAANIRVWWQDRPGAPQQFSYEDKLSSPNLRVTMRRVITYRLVDYGDMVLYAEIEGLRGRPTSGVLGALFALIGEVPVVESRMAISPDGLQISRGRGKKGLVDVTQTMTLTPEGRAEKGLPPGRPDLVPIEERLKRKLELDFKPLPPPPPRPAVR